MSEVFKNIKNFNSYDIRYYFENVSNLNYFKTFPEI